MVILIVILLPENGMSLCVEMHYHGFHVVFRSYSTKFREAPDLRQSPESSPHLAVEGSRSGYILDRLVKSNLGNIQPERDCLRKLEGL